MLNNKTKCLLGLGLASAIQASAQSVVNVALQPFGDTQTTLSWTMSGDVVSPSGAVVPTGYTKYIEFYTQFTNAINSLPASQVFIPLTGFGVLTNLTTGASQPLEDLELNQSGNIGQMILLVGSFVSTNQPYTALNVVGGQALEIAPASASEVIDLPFSDFNPGTYQYVYPGGPVAGPGAAFTTSLTFNLNIAEPAPEPGTLALVGVGVAGCFAARRRPAK